MIGDIYHINMVTVAGFLSINSRAVFGTELTGKRPLPMCDLQKRRNQNTTSTTTAWVQGENVTPWKLTWQAETSTMNEDVFPIENGDFPMSC